MNSSASLLGMIIPLLIWLPICVVLIVLQIKLSLRGIKALDIYIAKNKEHQN